LAATIVSIDQYFLSGEEMAVASTNALKKVLFDEYDGFADKRIKNLDKGHLFIIDDRKDADQDARGDLFLWFCQIFAEVIDKDTVRITMRGGVPNSTRVKKWLSDNGAKHSNLGVEITIRKGEERQLTRLAAAVRTIVAPGARYPVPSYKYVCPRVAASLDRFQQVLSDAWAS
jgi:hypothetical protein